MRIPTVESTAAGMRDENPPSIIEPTVAPSEVMLKAPAEGAPIEERSVEKVQAMDSTGHPEEVSMVAIQVKNVGDRAEML